MSLVSGGMNHADEKPPILAVVFGKSASSAARHREHRATLSTTALRGHHSHRHVRIHPRPSHIVVAALKPL